MRERAKYFLVVITIVAIVHKFRSIYNYFARGVYIMHFRRYNWLWVQIKSLPTLFGVGIIMTGDMYAETVIGQEIP